jgi:hypothetical protein
VKLKFILPCFILLTFSCKSRSFNADISASQSDEKVANKVIWIRALPGVNLKNEEIRGACFYETDRTSSEGQKRALTIVTTRLSKYPISSAQIQAKLKSEYEKALTSLDGPYSKTSASRFNLNSIIASVKRFFDLAPEKFKESKALIRIFSNSSDENSQGNEINPESPEESKTAELSYLVSKEEYQAFYKAAQIAGRSQGEWRTSNEWKSLNLPIECDKSTIPTNEILKNLGED